ncbi:hypothetical protein [Amycolatopsis sp.]|uniref:hypothetical protein n=1 Tax=Amycolatopsis sp. TaxID=37632 RepID=UPI002CCF8E9D|nr:hypothetical protein [Amycolatopsis sp.]HVV13320.1 hypothetical protein [Amycolatopsis sp.]
MTVRIGDIALIGRKRDQDEEIHAARARTVALPVSRRRRHFWWYQLNFGAPKPR